LKEFKIDPLTRIEGLGRVYIKTEKGTVKDVRLEIFEPPRFFEAILKRKTMNQVIDIVARICGLCPVAYQMSAVEAFENIIRIEVPEHIKKLRRALYCGEWVSSHSAHIFFLHLPDFFGKESFIELAREKKELIEAGIKLRSAGNKIIELLGGRHIHPINIKVGGFYKLPSEKQVEKVIREIESVLSVAESMLKTFLSFEYPEFELDYEFVSLGNTNVYPIMEGRIVSSGGWSIKKDDYEQNFEEYQKPHSTALYSKLRKGRFYLVGALSRFNNNFHKLPSDIKELVRNIYPVKNPFESIIVRSVEVLYALREAKEILEKTELGEPSVEWKPREGEGVGITEAPRGILYHKYRVNSEGLIEYANIVPPTSQNQGIMEETLFEGLKTLRTEDMRTLSEKLIRNFDPCISCASHYIEVI